MKRSHIIILAVTLAAALVSCREDKAAGPIFVEPVEVSISYSSLGVDIPFSNPFKITMSNSTEQFTYTFTSDTWGRARLERLMPGAYTVSIAGQLTKEEIELITGEPAEKSASVSGFVSNLYLELGKHYELNDIRLFIMNSSALIFKELYYAGSPTGGSTKYRNDNFYSIHNNSAEPVSINNLYIGIVENYGSMTGAGPQWPGEEAGNYTHVYVQSAWKIIAGDNPVSIDPGKDIVIATMAAPHNTERYNPLSPVNLSGADYEAFSADPQNPYPDFLAPNMKLAFWPAYAYLWRMGVFGQGIVLIEATAGEFDGFEVVELPETFWSGGENDEYWLCKKVPLAYVIDAVDLIPDKTTTAVKRFPPTLDAGYATVEGTYTSTSVIRKVQSIIETEKGKVTIYQDTNNSTEDFEINEAPLTK